MRNRLKKLFRCQRGNTMIIMTAVMPMLVGAGAVGIDVAQWALTKRSLQRIADTGAIAGAAAVYQKQAVNPAVSRSLDHNNQVVLSTPIVVENAPTVGTFAGDTAAVRVVATATPQLTFVSMFLSTPTTISAEATARAMPDPKYCMVTLEDANTPGFDFSGSAGVNANCGLMSNSKAKPSAVTFGGSAASVSSNLVAAVGPLRKDSNWSASTTLTPFQPNLQDPYAYAPEASTYASPCSPGTAQVVEGNQWNNRVFGPSSGSVGCWSSLSFKTAVTIQSGTYVVNGGTLEFTAGANVTANGPVTFILTGPNSASIASIQLSGNAIVNLSAPTSGPLRDILFYQDRRARELGTENLITGNAGSTFNGGVYFPGSNLHFTGNSSTTGTCIKIVSLRMSFTGNSAANISCNTTQQAGLFGMMMKLVA